MGFCDFGFWVCSGIVNFGSLGFGFDSFVEFVLGFVCFDVLGFGNLVFFVDLIFLLLVMFDLFALGFLWFRTKLGFVG